MSTSHHHKSARSIGIKVSALIASLLVALPAFAGSAYFTGRQEMVQTVTYRMAWKSG